MTQNMMTGLHWAASKNNMSMVDLLLSFNSDPNHFDIHGNTVMMHAIKNANYKMIKKLLIARAIVVTKYKDMSKISEDHVIIKILSKAKFLLSTLVMIGPKTRYAQWSQMVSNWMDYISFSY